MKNRDPDHPWIKYENSKGTDKAKRRLADGKYEHDPLTRKAVRNMVFKNELRIKATKAEIVVGDFLYEKGVGFVFQKGFFSPFHRIVDFYVGSLQLIIEIDGGIHLNQVAVDRNKDEKFRIKRGMSTIRITNEQVYAGEHLVVLAWVIDKAWKREDAPRMYPMPFLRREREPKDTALKYLARKTPRQKAADEKRLLKARRKEEHDRNARKIALRGWGVI